MGLGSSEGHVRPSAWAPRTQRLPAARPVWKLPCAGEGVRAMARVVHHYRELREAPLGRPQWSVCKWQAWFQAASPPPGWLGRQGAGRLAGSAFYCCCAAVPAEPSTAEYRWCLFNLAPPPRLSFNCSVPLFSNKLCALLKHCTSYRYCQSSSKFMVRMC